MSCASGLLAPISEQPDNSIETAASDALVIKRIFTPIAAHPGMGRVVFVTRITWQDFRPLVAQASAARGMYG